MSAYTVTLSGVYTPGTFTTGYGGPYVGGHVGKWYNKYGMDLGAAPGAEVYAAFDAVITVGHQHNPAADDATHYGAELFMRYPNRKMGGFYTHITDVPAKYVVTGTSVARGDYLGRVLPHPPSPHVHFALIEFVDGTESGIDNLYQLFQELTNTDSIDVTFMQDGTQPVIELG